MPMQTPNEKLAAEITKYLKSFEMDPAINDHDHQQEGMKIGRFWHAHAVASGAKIGIVYISFQGRIWLTAEEAQEYLAWLRQGWVGKHFDWQRGTGKKIKVKPYVKPKNEPTLIDESPVSGREYAHPSWGTATVSRCAGTHNLFGSDLEHMHFLSLRIHTATKCVNETGREHISTAGSKQIVEVFFSEAQYAQLISSVGGGGGVPCTIRHIQGEMLPECPPPATMEQFLDAVAGISDDLQTKARQLEEDLSKRFEDSKPLTKAEKKALLEQITMLSRGFSERLPYVQKAAQERLEEQVEGARVDIQGYLISEAAKLGINVATQRANLLGAGMDSKPALQAENKLNEKVIKVPLQFGPDDTSVAYAVPDSVGVTCALEPLTRHKGDVGHECDLPTHERPHPSVCVSREKP
jgi:hypothetical protein